MSALQKLGMSWEKETRTYLKKMCQPPRCIWAKANWFSEGFD